MRSRIILKMTLIAAVLNLLSGQHQVALALFMLVQVIGLKNHSARSERSIRFFGETDFK